ncbi:MAG: hypothetical protein LLF83_11405 [Methanobacterium sp.]|nr:hypothetical protein [Methanobacterium sp.]
MAKSLDILMAGLIAGLVAYTTSQLGIGGTVLGAVLGSMLYQLISHFIKEPVENVKTQKVEREIFYVFPLVIILAIEVIYLLADLYHRPEQIFFTLEYATGNNLFKLMGLGLIIMGIYPIIQPKNIKKIYGYILVVIGVIKLLVGFADVNNPVVMLYAPVYYQLNELVSVVIIAALAYVIFAIGKESIQLYYKKDVDEDNNSSDEKVEK